MGILFDSRNFATKSTSRQLGNKQELLKVRSFIAGAIEGIYAIDKLSADKIVISGDGTEKQDKNFQKLVIKGDFTGFIENADANDTIVQSLNYSGKDGKLKMKNIGDADSSELGSVGEWLSFGDDKLSKSIFAGDDVIYATKKKQANQVLMGFKGDDELILYGGERANGGSGRDTFKVTKNAITRKSNTAVEEQQVVIEDATKKDGDSVILPRIKGGYVGIKQVSYEPETNSNLNGTILLEESGSTVDPVFG